MFVLGLTTGGVEIGCPSLLFYYTTKFVVCQYAIRNFFYENRNNFSSFVLIYYEKRDTIAKRKGVKACDKVQSQSDACPAGYDPKGTGRKDGYPSAYGVRNLRGNGQALTRGCVGEDLRCAGLSARRPDGVCAGGCPIKHLVSPTLFLGSKRQ